MSDGVESSDSDAPKVVAKRNSPTRQEGPVTAPSTQIPSDADADDGEYETEPENSSSPETPPPQPLPTRPIYKSEPSIPASRTPSAIGAKASIARGKKGHGVVSGHVRQKSIGGKDKIVLAKRKSDGKRVQKDPASDERSRSTSPVIQHQSNDAKDARAVLKPSAGSTPADLQSHSRTTHTTIQPITAPKQVSSTTYSSSTPKASSYPTPSASYVPSQAHSGMSSTNASVQPPPGISRTRSHVETGATSRHSHSGRLEGQTIWGQWRRAGERSFGEVVDDVFKVVRVEDLVPKRVQSREMPMHVASDVQSKQSARSDQPSVPIEEPQARKKISNSDMDSGISWGEPSTKPLRILQEEISPRTTPGLQTIYHESPLQMADDALSAQQTTTPVIVAPTDHSTESPTLDDMVAVPSPGSLQSSNLATPSHAATMGPIVRVVEPTPAPSRVGSAGELSPLGGRLLASSAINQGFSRRKHHRQQAHEIASPQNQSFTDSGDMKSARGASSGVHFQPMTPLEQKHTPAHMKPAPVRRLSSARSDRSSTSSSAYTPGSPMVERENPMESAGLQQTLPSSQGSVKETPESPVLSGSVVQRLNDSATARPRKTSGKHTKHVEQQMQHPHSQSKKSKKSIFFIQSPGDNRTRRLNARKGSVSGGSEASTEADATSFAGSSVGLPSVAAQSPSTRRSTSGSYAATSPLAQEVARPMAEEVVAKRPEPAEKVKQAEIVPHAPGPTSRTTPDPPPPATQRRTSAGSKYPGAASGLKRTFSTAHANTHGHGHGHRTSVHHLTQVAAGHGKNHTTAAANLGAAKRTDSMSNMAGRLREMKANAAAAISARLAAQQKAEKERLAEQRNKLSAAKRQQSEPDMLAVQQSLLREAEEEAENDEDYEDVDDDTVGGEDDDDAWSSATDESAKNTGLVIGKAKPKPKRDPAAIAAAKAAAAEADAQRKRELFAKRAIFGPGGMTGMSTLKPSAPQPDSKSVPIPAPSSSISRPGLLTNLFEKQRDVLRRADSMVDIVSSTGVMDCCLRLT